MFMRILKRIRKGNIIFNPHRKTPKGKDRGKTWKLRKLRKLPEKKAAGCLLSVCFAVQSLAAGLCAGAMPYAEYMDGRREYMTANYLLSPGLTYTETLTENAKYGNERSYIFTYTPAMGTEILPAYGDYLSENADLSSIVKQCEANGLRVAGGINGDFYSMATGVPIGAMIVNGEILSSDNDRTAMGFDAAGHAFISKPNIRLKLENEAQTVSIEHINKYPLEYALYLLTDRFYPTTRTTKPSTEMVLMPYDEAWIFEDEAAYRAYEAEKSGKEKEKDEEKENGDGDKESEEKEDREKEPAEDERTPQSPEENRDFIYIYPETEPEEPDENDEIEVLPPEPDPTYDGKPPEVSKESGESEEPGAPSEPGEPAGSGGSESGSEPDGRDHRNIYAAAYHFSGEKLTIGGRIPVVVKEIRVDALDGEIPEGCFVLCAENELQHDRIKSIAVGDTFMLNIDADAPWENAVQAIGNAGGLILKDGEYCDDVEIDHYAYANPRTAAGITADGRVIFYCVDGRRGTSGGLRIDQLSHEMKKLGCVTAMNLDGGGSTTVYAALPGEGIAARRNTPSVSTERKTANSLLFINRTVRTGVPEKYTLSPQNPYVLAGGCRYPLGKPAAADHNDFPVSTPDDLAYAYFIDDPESDARIIDDGRTFVSGTTDGPVALSVRIGTGDDARDYPAGTVYVLDAEKIVDFTIGPSECTISPFDALPIVMTAEYHTAKIFYDAHALRWKLPDETAAEEAGEDDAAPTPDGTDVQEPDEPNVEAEAEAEAEDEFRFVPEDGMIENAKASLDAQFLFRPKTEGETLTLTAALGAIERTITVQVAPFPFCDSFTHWSAEYLYKIAGYGLMQGEPADDGFAFFPERNLTKSEFLTILARALYPEIDAAPPEENPDGAEAERKATEGAESMEKTEGTEGTENGFDESDGFVEPEEPKGSAEIPTAALPFADAADIPVWAEKYYASLAESGLLPLLAVSDESGAAKIFPNEWITRKEVLTVLGALCPEAAADFVSAFVDGESLIGEPYYDFINNALAVGIFTGYEDGTLHAERNLTRAETATVMLRFFDKADWS